VRHPAFRITIWAGWFQKHQIRLPQAEWGANPAIHRRDGA